MLTGKVGSLNVKNTVQIGNGFPSLFPVSLDALDMDYLAKADWISPLLIPSRKSVLTTVPTELRDMHSTGYNERNWVEFASNYIPSLL